MSAASENPSGDGESRTEFWQRMTAFLCFGMAVGSPAAQSLSALRFLPGSSVVETALSLSLLFIGTVAVARVVLAPFIDAFDPPGLKHLGRRRGWTALLVGLLLVLAVPIVLMAPASNPAGAPATLLGIVLMLAALIVAGALLAAVDGLRTAQPGARRQGALATAQYLGTVIPGAVIPLFLGRPDSLTISAFLCAFIAAAWLGLWMLPGGEAPAARLFERPELQRFLSAEHNLSRGGTAVTAWLYGVFVSPIADFFRRLGGLAWAVLGVLVLGDLATNLNAQGLVQLHAELLEAEQVKRISMVRGVAVYPGIIAAAWLAWRLGPVRGLAVSFGFAALAVIAGLATIAAAPSLAWYLIVVAVDNFAKGAILIGFIAFVARATSPAFAAFQFSLLWLVALPSGIIAVLRNASQDALGLGATYVLFLLLLAGTIALTWWLAGRLDETASQG
jgi:PAT family beta-lactamase induction signal transducer AmpG